MFSYQFNNFFAYMIKRVASSFNPINQITMVGPYVTLYIPDSNYTFNHHKLCVFSDMEPDHNDAHGTNILGTLRDQSYNHAHVILPGILPLDIELKNLLMSDKTKYGISESQIDLCVQQYQSHVENYSPTEHKLAIRNLVRSVVRYHYDSSIEDETVNNEDIEKIIEPVKRALALSLIEQNYSSLEKFRQALQGALSSLNPEYKNAFLASLFKVSPYSPYATFDRLMSSNRFGGKEPSVLGGISSIAIPASYVMMANFLVKSLVEDDSLDINEPNLFNELTRFYILLFGASWLLFKSPEIVEWIYNQCRTYLNCDQSYIDNDQLKTLVNDYQASEPDMADEYLPYEPPGVAP